MVSTAAAAEAATRKSGEVVKS